MRHEHDRLVGTTAFEMIQHAGRAEAALFTGRCDGRIALVKKPTEFLKLRFVLQRRILIGHRPAFYHLPERFDRAVAVGADGHLGDLRLRFRPVNGSPDNNDKKKRDNQRGYDQPPHSNPPKANSFCKGRGKTPMAMSAPTGTRMPTELARDGTQINRTIIKISGARAIFRFLARYTTASAPKSAGRMLSNAGCSASDSRKGLIWDQKQDAERDDDGRHDR